VGLFFQKVLAKSAGPEKKRKTKTMKSRFIILSAACVALFATVSIGQAQDPAATNDRPNRWQNKGGNRIEHLTRVLDLTPEQRAKVQAIFDQAKPQIQALRENIQSQIRPILTPAQQQKWDAIKKAREDMRKAKEEMRDAVKKQ